MIESPRIEGQLDASGGRYGIVAARFNERVVDRLVAGAMDCLVRHGAEAQAVTIVRVPGAWELPQALDALARRGSIDGLIALGAVIRGETPHFDYICAGATQGIANVASDHHLPVGYGLLTCDDAPQAEARAGGKAGNKGWEAALAVIEMRSLLSRLGEKGSG